MTRVVQLIILTCCTVTTVAQQHYTINYETRSMVTATAKNEIQYFPFIMVIRDSISFTYYPSIAKGTKYFPLGNRFLPKSSFSNRAACLQIFPAGEFGKPKTQRLVVDSCHSDSWTISEETRVIAGYTCKKAMGWRNGLEYTVWFAPELPAGFAPFFLHGLPGTILEYWHEKAMSYSTAVEIKKQAVGIVEPNYCKRISREEYDRQIRRY